MTEGFFRIAYTGMSGSGFGMVVLQNGNVIGADVSGGVYDGTYSEDQETGKISFSVNLAAPAGVPLVQTGVVLASPLDISITASLEFADISGERPVLFETALGPVNVILKKLRDFTAS